MQCWACEQAKIAMVVARGLGNDVDDIRQEWIDEGLEKVRSQYKGSSKSEQLRVLTELNNKYGNESNYMRVRGDRQWVFPGLKLNMDEDMQYNNWGEDGMDVDDEEEVEYDDWIFSDGSDPVESEYWECLEAFKQCTI